MCIYVWYDTRVTGVSQFHPDFNCKNADTVVKGEASARKGEKKEER